MADAIDDLFTFDDDLEAILDILEEDEAIEEQFSAAVTDAQSTDIVCSDCRKKYKTRGGYQRHRTAKHNLHERETQELATLTPSILAEIVHNAIQNVNGTKAFAASLRNELNLYRYEQLDGGTVEFSVLKALYEGYLKNGNTEKFYVKYYAQVPLNSAKFFTGLSRNAATLLATKVADSMLAHCKHMKFSTDSSQPSQTVLSEKEKAGLQYVGGYVLHNLHKKHAKTETIESQQAMAILKAGKLEDGCDSQKLVSCLSRGGLWSITEPAQKIFLKTEHNFRQSTSTAGLQRVDIAGITHKSVSDSELLSNYHLMVANADLVPGSHVIKDTLHGIISLYIRVRSFSFAKDIIQRHKIKSKQTKTKALRKEINRSCKEQQHERND